MMLTDTELRRDKTVTMSFVSDLPQACLDAPVLEPGVQAAGETSGVGNRMDGSCSYHLDATIHLIREPGASLPELLELVPGPDFPTGGIIHGRSGIAQAYHTGRGSVKVRARTHEEEVRSGRWAIVVTELPYMVNKANMVAKIADLVKDKRLEGISDVRDESDRDGVRVVIELKRDAFSEVVLNNLFKHTQLQVSFGMNMVAIVHSRPMTLGLKEMLLYFIAHRREVVTRRIRFELGKLEERAHILEGLLIALDHLDEVIRIIRSSPTPSEARDGLVASFGLSVRQAQAILEMRLQRLTGMEQDKLREEHTEVMAEIDRLREILADESKLMDLIVQELEEVKDQYNDERRTEIADAMADIILEDLIVKEDMVVTLSHQGYIKRDAVSNYRSQRRGGKGRSGMKTKVEDFVTDLFVASTHSHLLFFTNHGRVFRRKVYEIPTGGPTARGKALVNLLDLNSGEKVRTMLAISDFEDGKVIFMVTGKGIVKKTPLMAFANLRKVGMRALNMRDDDDLIGVMLVEPDWDILLTSHRGISIRFCEENVRSMGRSAMGVKGIRLRRGDHVVSACVLKTGEETVLTVCERGFGKRTAAEEYRQQHRGGKGIFTIRTSERNGMVVGTMVVEEEDELMLITSGGTLIRLPVSDLRELGRVTQGVKLIDLGEEQYVVGMGHIVDEGEEEEGEED